MGECIHSIQAHGYAAHDPSGILTPFSFTRRAIGPNDVAFKVTHCGICHSDLHQIRNDWKNAKYPMVPGHEVVGIVTGIGSQVTKFEVGDHVGVGCMVMSCGNCDACDKKVEQYCPKASWTYNSLYPDGSPTFGGYSNIMVTDQKFVLRIPKSLSLDSAAPLLCAGITVYSPMRYFGMTEKGKHFAVVGLGGLGHMAIKFAKAFGLEATVISTSPTKEKEAKEILGADHFLLSTDKDAMKKASRTIDHIIDTVAVPHDMAALMALLRVNGKMVLVGLPEKPFELAYGTLIFGRRFVGGSLIGGIEETQEMLDFCAEKNISATIEVIHPDYLNTAMDRLSKADVKYRFVIDMQSS